MATRKPHHKSKLGCLSCKARRIRCDQHRPCCRNCQKRGLECTFRSVDPPSTSPFSLSALEEKALSRVLVFSQSPEASLGRPSYSPSPPLLLDTLSQNGVIPSIPDALQVRFKQLLHHFSTVLISTVSGDRKSEAAWTAAIPPLACGHEYVLEGLFAVASLHLSRNLGQESERRIHSSIATDRMNRGLTKYRSEIQNVTEENAEALFTFSTIITAYVLRTVGDECSTILGSMGPKDLTLSRRQEVIMNLASMTIRILRCLHSVLVILVPCWHCLSEGPLSLIVTREWWPSCIPASPEAIEEDQRLRGIEKMWMNPGRKYEYSFDVLARALKTLREDFALVSQLTVRTKPTDNDGKLADWTSVMVWAVHASIEYVALLEQRSPEAWVILAHYAMLPARVKGIWWLDGMASNIVSTAALVLGEDRWDLIDWPARCVGVNLDGFRVTPPRNDTSNSPEQMAFGL